MTRYFLFALLLFYAVSVGQSRVGTKKLSHTYPMHGLVIQDDYAWLEEMDKAEVKTWVDQQNEMTQAHLSEIRKSRSSASKIKEYDQLSTNSLPIKKGKFLYSMYRTDRNRPPALFYRKNLNDTPKLLLDLSTVYDKKIMARLTNFKPSKNSKFLAYTATLDGSDRNEIRFSEIGTYKNLQEVITDVKFSNIEWNGESGVFYKKNSNRNRFEADSTFQLFYHKLGTPVSDDKLILDTSKTGESFSFSTQGGKLIVIKTSADEKNKSYHWAPLQPEVFELQKMNVSAKRPIEFQSYYKNRIYYSTSEYDWGEVRSADPADPSTEKVVIPQIYNHLLVDVLFLENYIICKYRLPGRNYIAVYDPEGTFIRKFEAPHAMDFDIKFYDDTTKDLYVSFYSYTISFHNYKLNLESGKSDSYFNDYMPPKPTLFPFDHFTTKTLTYQARDGESIPITIIHKKNLPLDNPNPTLLTGYGGFGSVSGPHYDTGLLYFLEKGGVYAYAEIRGGGEKGSKWHLMGKGLKKINTFNDFIDAAEYLIKEGYTNTSKLAISGGSQGGLLVGVAMTKRPDLFKVAIPKVGVFDMLRYDRFSVGKMHLDEYGNPAKKDEFESLRGYSPYHNISEDVNYPITLIITSENDDRVPPTHSYKFAARLQNRPAQKNPVYLKTLRNSGHSGRENYNSDVREKSEFYDFLLHHLQ